MPGTEKEAREDSVKIVLVLRLKGCAISLFHLGAHGVPHFTVVVYIQIM